MYEEPLPITKRFPFPPEGPPNKQPEKNKRPKRVGGYISASVDAIAEIFQAGLTSTHVVCYMTLAREYFFEKSRGNDLDDLRTPPSVRRAVKLDQRAYWQKINELAEAGFLEITATKPCLTVRLILLPEPKTVATHYNTATGKVSPRYM